MAQAHIEKKSLIAFCYWGGERMVNSNGTFLYKDGMCVAVLVQDGIQLNELIDKVYSALKISSEDKILCHNTKRDKTRYVTLKDENGVAMLFHLNEDEVDLFVDEMGRSNDNVPFYPSTRESNITDGNNTSVGGTTEQVTSQQCTNSCTKHMGLVPYLPEDQNECLTGKGQLFDSPDLFKQAITIFAASNKFSFKYLDYSKAYYQIVCDVDGCPWKLTAKCDGSGGMVRVIMLKDEHKHNASDAADYKPTIRSKQVGLLFKHLIKEKPEFLPRNICTDYERAFQCRLTYNQGWRAKEKAKEFISGPPSVSFHLVPWMCRRLVDSIPDTRAIWTSDDKGKFKQLFVSYGCSIGGFLRGCRPVLKVDACHLSGHYRGHCLLASAHDSDNGLYPLAYAIVSGENDEDWLWFLENLKEVLGGRTVVLVTDRNPSLLNGIIKVFGGDCNAWCLRYLKENFSKFASNKGIKNEKRQAALKILDQLSYARTDTIFKFHFRRLCAFHADFGKWVEDNNPKHWSNAYFPYKRWDKMYSNLAECFNSWILPLRSLDIIEFMTGHVTQLSDMLLRKRAAIGSWQLPIGPNIHKDIHDAQFVARNYTHRPTSATEFTVQNTALKKFAVKFLPRTCSCLAWQMSGVPCAHACRAITNTGFSIYDMVDPILTKAAQMKIYEVVMSPVVLHDMPPISSLGPSGEPSYTYTTEDGISCVDPSLHPPAPTRPPGRPKKRRIESQTQEKATVTYIRCRERGHNRSTCKSAIPG